MPWKCTVCGYENPDDANFCLRCGAQKPAQPTVEPMQQPVTAQQPNPQQQTTPTQPQQQVPAQPEVAQSQPQAVQVVTPPPQPDQSAAQQVVTQPSATQPQHKYYLLFIQTPYTSLINQKVPLNFDIFPSISIGRSPENVIIVPDPEVSRRHAVISLEGGDLYIEDLNSTNGTYVYDGKLFQPIKGKQKIAPNSIIKLGNQTIVRIITE